MIGLTAKEASAYARDGYIIRKGLLSTGRGERLPRPCPRAQLEAESTPAQ